MFKRKHAEITQIRQIFLDKLNIELPGFAQQFPDALQLLRGQVLQGFNWWSCLLEVGQSTVA
jgi:hypothetical protein